MKNREKLFKKIRKVESELLVASPSEAAKLAAKVVKWKGRLFD